MSFIFAACGSKDDGTRIITNIDIVSQADLQQGLYPGKFKIKIKNKDGNQDWFYTNMNFTVGDTLISILKSQFVELEVKVVKLEAKVVKLEAKVATYRDILKKIYSEILKFEATENLEVEK